MTDTTPAAPITSPTAASATTTGTVVPAAPPGALPDSGSVMMWNIGLIVVLVVMFYLLLIMPQQRRFKEHKLMLDSLKKGDRVVAGGGLVGRVEKILDDEEILIDLGNGVKVTALRAAVQTRLDAKKGAGGEKDKESKDHKDA
jgi:preprotein translocase subunit YajC